jgi:hypothetical protein
MNVREYQQESFSQSEVVCLPILAGDIMCETSQRLLASGDSGHICVDFRVPNLV